MPRLPRYVTLLVFNQRLKVKRSQETHVWNQYLFPTTHDQRSAPKTYLRLASDYTEQPEEGGITKRDEALTREDALTWQICLIKRNNSHSIYHSAHLLRLAWRTRQSSPK